MTTTQTRSSLSAGAWWACRQPRPQARSRLFCCPHAGGTTTAFFAWPPVLPGVEVHALQLPGRERRRHEPLMTRLEPLVAALVEAIMPLLDRPFALFGHSLGALVAFELVRALRRCDQPQPQALLLASRRAPQLPPRNASVPLHRLSEAEFLHQLQQRYGDLPAVVRAEPELLELFLPLLRADIEMLETYRYVDEQPLHCRLVVYGGTDDPSTSPTELDAWRAQTTGTFARQLLPGDHFFPQQARQSLLMDIARQLGGP